jgi:hypothetical protein
MSVYEAKKLVLKIDDYTQIGKIINFVKKEIDSVWCSNIDVGEDVDDYYIRVGFQRGSITVVEYCVANEIVLFEHAFPKGAMVVSKNALEPRTVGLVEDTFEAGKVCVDFGGNIGYVSFFPNELEIVESEEEMGRRKRITRRKARMEKMSEKDVRRQQLYYDALTLRDRSEKNPEFRTLRIKFKTGEVIYVQEKSKDALIPFIVEQFKLDDTQVMTAGGADYRLSRATVDRCNILEGVKVRDAMEIEGIDLRANIRGEEENVISMSHCAVCKTMTNPDEIWRELGSDEICNECVPVFTEALWRVCELAENKSRVYNITN